MSRSTKTFYIENLGCAKNQVDAEILLRLLEDEGWVYSDQPEVADILIVNSCGFIEAAKEESIQSVIDLRTRCPGGGIVLTGCLAQRYGGVLGKTLPEADGIVGNRAPEKARDFILDVAEGRRGSEIPEHSPRFPYRNRLLSYPGSVYVKIAEGCNNRCSYCAIPNIRGPLLSRNHREVLNEIEAYLQKGIREIILLAQDLGSYGNDFGESNYLEKLLSEIRGVKGEFWVRLLYIHPDHFLEGLLDICGDDNRILPYFDLPFQHGSKRILERMGRKGGSGDYLRLIERIRERLPGVFIRSTFLLGFPGEEEEDFEELLDFQDRARIDWLGVFVYSREEGTRAYALQNRFSHCRLHKKALRRKEIVESRQEKITAERLEGMVGTKQQVLIEERFQGKELFLGRGYFQAPDVDGLMIVKGSGLVPGMTAECLVTKRVGVDLEGIYL